MSADIRGAGSPEAQPRVRSRVAVIAIAALAVGLIAPAAVATSASAETSSNLLLKYDLNDASGTQAFDSSGHNNNATLTAGAAFTASGKNYGGVQLDGTDDYVKLPNGALQGAHDVTLSVDVKLDATKHQWYGTLGYSSGKYIGIEQNGATLTGYFTNSNQQTVSAGNVAPATGSWATVTLVIDTSTNHTMKLYVDGSLKATTSNITGDPAGIYDSTQTFGGYVGKSVWNGDPYLAAKVDDFRVYNSALSAADVGTLAALAPTSPAAVTPVSVSTSPGTAPSLPSTVSVPATDGTDQSLPVQWSAVTAGQYASPGNFDVAGTTQTTPSLPATAHVAVLPVPALTVTSKGQTSISLSWQHQDNVAKYFVSRSTTSGGPYTEVYAGTETNFTDAGLSLGTKYYYVMHYDVTSGGSSTSSAELAVKTDTKLVAPPALTQSSYLMTNRVELDWNAVALADSYNLYRSDSPDGPFTLLASPTGLSYKDNDVTDGTTYYYEIASVNDAGEGAISAPLEAKTAVDNVPPTTLTTTAQTDSTIALSWAAKSGASSYQLYRSSTTGSGYSLVYDGADTTFTDSNLVTGASYYYVVSYTNSLGTSANSKELKVDTKSVTVPAPSAVKAIKTYTNAINLGWNGVVGAKSFNVYRADSADGTYALVKNTTGTSYTDKNLAPGTTYYYKLTSANAAGESSRSDVFTVTTETGADTILTNSTQWYDNNGDPILAGSGSILLYDGVYYWYGGGGGGPFDTNVYSSTDLIHWKFENRILTTGSKGIDGKPAADLSLAANTHFERDKVIYNPGTHQFVFITHYENADYTLADIGTAYSDTPTGDFTWDHAFRPAGLDSRDSTAYVDTDGTGYIISATLTNSKVTLFKLTPDFLSVDSQMYNIYGGANDSGIYAGREAPAMVKSNGIYYLITSGASGWYPSNAMYSTATASSLADTSASSWKGSTNVDAMGGWDGGGVANYLGNRNDFGGQSVYILPVTGTHGTSFLLMNDTLDPKNSGVGGPMWLPLKLDDGVATLNYSKEININAKAGEITNVYSGSLISQGKPATASSSATTDSDGNVNPDGWTAKYANDGDYSTEWIASGSTYPSWWEVDLGQEYNVSDVQLSWWMIGGSEATEDFQIQVSDDDVNWSVAYDLSSGDKQYGFNDAQFPDATGRYVRVTILGSHTQNNNGGWYVPQLYEARVFGSAAPSSTSAGSADANGNYSAEVPSNVVNYPATGSYSVVLGGLSVKFPTSDLLSHLANGALTVTNGSTSSATVEAIKSVTALNSTIVKNYDLTLGSADGTAVTELSSPANVSLKLSAAEIAALSGEGTPKVYYFDPASKSLVDTNAVFDLGNARVSYATAHLGSFVVELTGQHLDSSISVKVPTVTYGKAAAATIQVTAGGAPAGGQVTTTYHGVSSSVSLSSEGTARVSLGSDVPAGKFPLLVSYAGSESTKPQSASATVTVGKASTSTSLKLSKATATRKKTTVKAAITVTVPGTRVQPSGTIVIKVNGKTMKTVKLATSAHGKITVSLGKFQATGTKKVAVTFKGGINLKSSTSVVKAIKVRK